MKNLKLLILDIDGVLTDGTKIYDNNHQTIAKRYADKDFTAIRIFNRLNINVCLLSSDQNINEAMAKKRGIDFYYSRNPDGSINKKRFLPILANQYNAKVEEIFYIGDDFFDLDIMLELPFTNRVCPNDSPLYVKNKCGIILERNGGTGVVAEFLEKYLNETLRYFEINQFLGNLE